jgi:long-subunit fatty acid transport protein
MTSSPRVLGASLAVILALAWAGPGHAQFKLGQQRAGTSSGSFLKIGVGARATALGESFVAVANDPSAIYWNPAGLASVVRQEVMVSHVDWPGDINFEHAAWVIPSRRFGGSFAFQVGSLSTTLDETSELQPYGTGRQFLYSDVVAGLAYARRWTDKLLVGFGLKYVREDLGSDVGGPVTNATLVDMGSIYYLGYGSVRIATSLTNFGPEMTPSGHFVSPLTGEIRNYDGFDPPIQFRYGLAFEPIENSQQKLTASIEIAQPADNAQRVKAGLEWTLQHRLSLRTGYDFNSDEMKLAAGLGLLLNVGQRLGTLDYAYTDGGVFGAINRLSLGLRF